MGPALNILWLALLARLRHNKIYAGPFENFDILSLFSSNFMADAIYQVFQPSILFNKVSSNSTSLGVFALSPLQ